MALQPAVKPRSIGPQRRAYACPPVVEYTRELQARAADELDLLPEGSAIAEMLADYSVMRTQVEVAECDARFSE